MELNSEITSFLNLINENPQFVVFGNAFGVPLFMFVYAMTVGRLIRSFSFSSAFNYMFFVTLGLVWLIGFIVTMPLLFVDISGIKMFLVWLLLLLFFGVFVITNVNSIRKFFDEKMLEIKEITNKNKV